MVELAFEFVTDQPSPNLPFSYIAKLFNEVFANYNLAAYLESIENGYICFFGSYNDLNHIFQYLNLPECPKYSEKPSKKNLKPVIWHLNFTKVPPNKSIKDLFHSMENFWQQFSDSINIQPDLEDSNKFDLIFPSRNSSLWSEWKVIEFFKQIPLMQT
jgi:hypothetical protein